MAFRKEDDPSWDIDRFYNFSNVSKSSFRSLLKKQFDEDGKNRIGVNLMTHWIYDIAKNTGIAYEVVARASMGYTTYYDFRGHRFVITPFEHEIVSRQDLKQRAERANDRDISKYGSVWQIAEDRQALPRISKFLNLSYPKRYLFDRWEDYVEQAKVELHDGCYIIRDRNDLYCGHFIVIPMVAHDNSNWTKHIAREEHVFCNYTQDGKFAERKLVMKSDDMGPDVPVHFHIFSFHAVHTVYAYILLKKLMAFIRFIPHKCNSDKSILTALPVRQDARVIVGDALNMTPTGDMLNGENYAQLYTVNVADIPKMYG